MWIRTSPSAVAAALALTLFVGSANAANYRVVAGSVSDVESGEERPLGGEFDITFFDPGGEFVINPGSLRIDDFLIEIGDESFGPSGLISYDDHPALLLRIADHIQFDGDAVTFAFFQAGGDFLSATDTSVDFRFLQFRADGPDAGELIGTLDDGVLPKRIVLNGTLTEIDQSFRFPPEECPVIVLPPMPIPLPPLLPIGGAVVSVGGSGAVTVPEETLVFRSPNVPVSSFTLEALGITAPDGATVSYDGATLTIQTTGDLQIADGRWDVPVGTTVRIEAGGTVTVGGTLTLPEDASLFLEVGGAFFGNVDIEDNAAPPDDTIVSPPIRPIFCDALLPVFPANTNEVASFSLELAAVQPVEIDVRPHRFIPRYRRDIWVTIYGSEGVDVRDVDVESLLFGSGEAEVTTRGRWAPQERDVNRDGITDLTVRFNVRDSGIATGDEEVCLSGDTADGFAIEGCGEIDTQPRKRRVRRGRRSDLGSSECGPMSGYDKRSKGRCR